MCVNGIFRAPRICPLSNSCGSRTSINCALRYPFLNCSSDSSLRYVRCLKYLNTKNVTKITIAMIKNVMLCPPSNYVHSLLYGVRYFISRSEEHTSELQSRFDLVCRLLLEKKKILMD